MELPENRLRLMIEQVIRSAALEVVKLIHKSISRTALRG